nr:hypothetical protein CFP56_78135 [Quercus suber]
MQDEIETKGTGSRCRMEGLTTRMMHCSYAAPVMFASTSRGRFPDAIRASRMAAAVIFQTDVLTLRMKFLHFCS